MTSKKSDCISLAALLQIKALQPPFLPNFTQTSQISSNLTLILDAIFAKSKEHTAILPKFTHILPKFLQILPGLEGILPTFLLS